MKPSVARHCIGWRRFNLLRRGTGLAFGSGLLLLVACTRSPESAAPPPRVSTLTVTARTISTELPVSGVIEPVEKTELGFMVPGRIAAIAVEDGATVAAGQELARLDDTDYRQELAIAEAKLNETKARYARLRQMHELGSLTATDFDKITATLQETEAAAQLARQRLGYTVLHAPYAGRIVRHKLAVGTVVAPGVPLCAVIAPAPVWATLSVPEVDALRIQPGQAVHVSLAAMESTAEDGSVETVLPQADALTRSFAVKIRLANHGYEFRPGNVVTARIMTGQQRTALLVPPTAIQHYPDGGLYVWIVGEKHPAVTRRLVEVGAPYDTRVEIVSGLQPGEVIVAGSSVPLFDGMAVTPVAP